MAKLKTVWLVTDPLPGSELGDILSKCSLVPRTDLVYLFDLFRGMEVQAPGLWEKWKGTIYLDGAEARRDAKARLKRLTGSNG